MKRTLLWGGLLFLLALSLRVLFVGHVQASPFGKGLSLDSAEMDRLAGEIASGQVVGREVFFQAPLYPYLLGAVYALVGRSLHCVRLLQAIAGAVNCVLLAMAAGQLGGRRAGAIAGLVAAVYLPFIFFDGMILKTSLGVLLFSAALVAAVRASTGTRLWVWALTGFLCGAAVLVRENVLVAAALLVGYGYWESADRRHGLTRAAVTIAGIALAVLPVTIRNVAVSGDLVLVTCQGGQNFYIGNDPEQGRGTYVASAGVAANTDAERVEYARTASRLAGRDLSPSEVSRFWYRRALGRIAQHPGLTVRLWARKFLAFWSDHEIPDNYSMPVMAEYSWLLRTRVLPGFGVVACLGALGAVLTWPGRRRFLPLYLMGGAVMVTVVAFFVFARYRLAVAGPLIVLGACGLDRLPELLHGGDRRRIVGVLAAVLAMAGLAYHGRLTGRRPSPVQQFTALYNLGNAARRAGRPLDAVAAYRRALAIDPNNASAHNNLGIAYKSLGLVDEAKAAYERAIELAPRMTRPHVNLGNLYAIRGQRAASAAAYRRALAIDPDNEEATRLLAALHRKPAATIDALEARLWELSRPGSSAEELRETLRRLAGLCLASGRHGRAEDLYRRLVAMEPGNGIAYEGLGQALHAQGKREPAMEAYERAVERNPGAARAWKNLGVCRAGVGRFEDAIAALDKVVALRPKDGEPHYLMARIHADALNDNAAAKRAAVRAKELGYRVPADFANRLGIPVAPQGAVP